MPTPPPAAAAGGENDAGSPIPGYQSLSPPPRMSALPLASLASPEFSRNAPQYNSLPVRFNRKSVAVDDPAATPNYNRWLPGIEQCRSNKNDGPAGRDSPEEGGFLEFNNNNHNKTCHRPPSAPPTLNGSPTPSVSSCSLDVSFNSSINDSIEVPVRWPVNTSRPSSADSVASAPCAPPKKISTPSPALIKRTTIMDFKRKLLQHSKSPSTSAQRVSAVELLKATKPPPPASPVQRQQAPAPVDLSPLESLIRRSARVSYIANRLNSANRFRTDVLSATIVEGCSEEDEPVDSKPTTPATTVTPSTPSTPSSGSVVRRQLSFQSIASAIKDASPRRGSLTPTPIETSL